MRSQPQRHRHHMTAFPNFPETCVRELCVGAEIQNTEYRTTGHGHGHGHGHEYGISATPAMTPAAGCKTPGFAVRRSFTFTAHTHSSCCHGCCKRRALRGTNGSFVGGCDKQNGGRDLHLPHSTSLPKTTGARTRIRTQIRLWPRLRPNRRAQWLQSGLHATKIWQIF